MAPRGNKLIKALFEGPMILINDRDRARPKVIEPLRVAHIIMKVGVWRAVQKGIR